MSNVYIELSPDLSIDPNGFATAWNDTPECRAAGEANVTPAGAAQYDPTGAVAALVTVSLGLATAALYDLIKLTLSKKGVDQTVEITEINQPDGTRVVIVRQSSTS